MVKKSCTKCHGEGIIFSIKEDHLFAEICPKCSKECDICGGKGYIIKEDKDGYSFSEPCECRKILKKVSLFNKADIPARFINASLESFKVLHLSHEEAKIKAKRFIKKFPMHKQGLIFMGPVGTGKTHLAVAIIKELILKKGVNCKFVDFFNLLSTIREGYNTGKSEMSIIEPYLSSDVLVIDEMGKGRNTAWELSMLDQMITYRYNSSPHKALIITTNYTNDEDSTLKEPILALRPNEKIIATHSEPYEQYFIYETLKDRIGERIYSRISEMCEMITLEGEDYRIKKGSKISDN